MLIRFIVIFFAFFSSSLAFANLEVRFIEGAPKDEFVITNQAGCKLSNFVLSIDLSRSKGRLYFDTTKEGLGVDVFQPFEITQGEFVLRSHSAVGDGDEMVTLAVNALGKGESIRFTVDVDDRLENSRLGQTRVSGEEIKEAEIIFFQDNNTQLTTVFGSNNTGAIELSSC